MANGFYGDLRTQYKTVFTFQKIYENRKQMEENASDDKVDINSYILVNYENPSNPSDTDRYNNNKKADEGYGRSYDSTVWQKQIVNGEFKYVMIAELNTVVPVFVGHSIPPSMDPTPGYIELNEDKTECTIEVPSMYGIQMGTLTVGNAQTSESAINQASFTQGYSEAKIFGNDNPDILKLNIDLSALGRDVTLATERATKAAENAEEAIKRVQDKDSVQKLKTTHWEVSEDTNGSLIFKCGDSNVTNS